MNDIVQSRQELHRRKIGSHDSDANGYPRATKVADFLVSDDAFVTKAGGVVLLAPGIPFQVDGVAVDYLSAAGDESHLAAALEGSFGKAIDAARRIYMKLKANRLRDQLDVVELIKAGVDRAQCRSYLVEHASSLVELFDRYAGQAATEQADEESPRPRRDVTSFDNATWIGSVDRNQGARLRHAAKGVAATDRRRTSP